MVRRSTRLAACVALVVAGLVAPAHAKPKGLRSEGCVAIGTHSVAVSGVRPWDCRFIATGSGTYVAATSNPFVISVSIDDGFHWRDIVRRASRGAPTQGRYHVNAGDLVAVSISCWDYTLNTWCKDAIGGRYGSITAYSDL
jgi:hypothetical protein